MEGLTVGTTVHFVYPDYTGDQVGGNYRQGRAFNPGHRDRRPRPPHLPGPDRVLDEARGTVNLHWFGDVARSVARNVMNFAHDQGEVLKEGTWHKMEQHK